MNKDTDKDYVGMSLCFFCGKATGVVLDKRLRKTLPKLAVYDYEPCDECAGYMKQGIMLISVVNDAEGRNPRRTGRMSVIKEEAIRNVVEPEELADSICKARWAFVPDDAWRELGLPMGEEG